MKCTVFNPDESNEVLNEFYDRFLYDEYIELEDVLAINHNKGICNKVCLKNVPEIANYMFENWSEDFEGVSSVKELKELLKEHNLKPSKNNIELGNIYFYKNHIIDLVLLK